MEKFRFLQLDFAEAEKFAALVASFKPEYVAHLGAQPGVRYSLENPAAYVHSNLVGFSSVLEACRRWGMVFTAYCPLARGRVFKDPVLAEIAKNKGRTVAQIALRWLMQQGNIAAIPRSANPAHMGESLQVFDFELTGDEMRRIAALKRPDGRIANPCRR